MSETDDETTAPTTLEELYLTPVASALLKADLCVTLVEPRRLDSTGPHYLLVCAKNDSPRAATVAWRMVSDTRWEFKIACVDSLGDFHPRETSIVKGSGDGHAWIPQVGAEILRRVDAWLRPVLRSVR